MSSPFFAAVAEVAALVVQAPQVLVGFDIEKVLVTVHNGVVRVSEPLRRQLMELSGRPRTTVAVLSARNRAEVQAEVGVPGLVYVGNLGLEISGDGFLFVEPTAAGYSDELSRLGKRLAGKLAAIPGALVEDKGLTIRIVASGVAESASEEVRRLIHETLASVNHPFHLWSRGLVYEIRPRVPWTKANALAWIKEHLGQPEALVVYVCADDNDEETIAALPHAVTIKVGGPTETLANYRLDKSEDVGRFMNWLKSTLLVPSPAYAVNRGRA